MKPNDAILTFDTLYTTNEIQILKLAIPLLSPSLRPYAALLIKGKELKYCMDLLPKGKIENAKLEFSYLDTFLEHAMPYCNDEQKEFFGQIKSLRHNLEMFEKMKGMMSLFSEDNASDLGMLFQTFSHSQSMSSSSPMNDLLSNVMSDEQSKMFEKFKKQFETEL